MRSAWIKASLIGLALAAAPARAGEGPHLLANLNREVSPASVEGEPSGFFELGGRLLFTTTELISLSHFGVDSDAHTPQLWQSDGTPEGTRMVVDLAPGGYSSVPAFSTLTVANGYLFFAADDGKTGLEPWALPLAP